MNPAVVIGISSVTGGGKTAVTQHLVEALGDAVALHFDDYDDTNVHPVDLQVWSAAGADYDAYETPVFTNHLWALKVGRRIRYPIGNVAVAPARYVVADAPLGRAHSDSGRSIDLMVFIDTPLDVALTRRMLRDIDRQNGRTSDEALHYIEDELSGYLAQARPIFEEFQERLRATSDVIVDGTLSIDDIVEKIRFEVEARFPSQLVDGHRE